MHLPIAQSYVTLSMQNTRLLQADDGTVWMSSGEDNKWMISHSSAENMRQGRPWQRAPEPEVLRDRAKTCSSGS